MSEQLLDLAKRPIGNHVTEQLSQILGVSPERTRAAVDVALSALLGGLMQKVSTPEGRKQVFRALDDYDGGLLQNLDALLGDGNHLALLQRGTGLAPMFLGSRQGAVVGAIAKEASIPENSSDALLGLLAPVVLSALGKLRRSSEFDAAEMASLLARQHLAAALPGELSVALELEPLPDDERVPSGTAEGVADVRALGAAPGSGDAEQGEHNLESPVSAGVSVSQEGSAAGGGLFAVFLPLILLAGLSWLGYVYLGPGNKPNAQESQQEPAPATESVPETP